MTSSTTTGRVLVAAKQAMRKGGTLVLLLKSGERRELEPITRPELMWGRVRVEHREGTAWLKLPRLQRFDVVGAFRDLPPRSVQARQSWWSTTPERHAAIREALREAAANPREQLRKVLRRMGVSDGCFYRHTRRGGAMRAEYEAVVRANPARTEWAKLARQWTRDGGKEAA